MTSPPLAALVDRARNEFRRSFRRLVAGQPELTVVERADDGLFGPRSVTWVVHGDLAMLVGGLRALLYQTLHPLAMAGVADHSDYRTDPLGRLHRTVAFLGASTYGDTAAAEQAVDVVRSIHRRVQGTAPDGRPYTADDPHLLRWVHATEVDSFLHAYRNYGTTLLADDQADTYVAEMAEIGRRLGVVDPPTDTAALAACLAAYDDELHAGTQARDGFRFLAAPPLPLATRPAYGLLFGAAYASLPPRVRRHYGVPVLPGVEPWMIRPTAFALLRLLGLALDTPPDVAAARARLTAG